jgi:hypothetical protein
LVDGTAFAVEASLIAADVNKQLSATGSYTKLLLPKAWKYRQSAC